MALKSFDEYKDSIYTLIGEFAQNQKIEDLKAVSQNVWDGCLMFVGFELFPFRDKGRWCATNAIDVLSDGEMLERLCDFYVMICMMYDKVPNVFGFASLLHIQYQTIMEWKDNNIYINTISENDEGVELRRTKREILRKLLLTTEQGHVNNLSSGKKNPVGTIAILNHRFGWNRDTWKPIEETQNRLSLSDLPLLEQNTIDSGNPGIDH